MPKTVTVEVPDELLAKIQKVAESHNQPLESVMLESITRYFSDPLPEAASDDDLEALSEYSDERLWAVVRRHLTPPQEDRMERLTEKNKAGTLSEPEELQLDLLLELIDDYMLLRSQALVLLKERGYDVSHYFGGTTNA